MWTASTVGRSSRSASPASHVVKWFICSNVYIYFCVHVDSKHSGKKFEECFPGFTCG